MDEIIWCFKKKKGIRIVKPSDNLCTSYISKAENSLISMRLNFREGISEWAASAAYYARYDVLYALLMKCGMKSEIHKCTIAIARTFFKDYISDNMIKELKIAKDHRIDLQYYTNRPVNENALKKNIDNAGAFVLSLKDVINKISEKDIQNIREKLKVLR